MADEATTLALLVQQVSSLDLYLREKLTDHEQRLRDLEAEHGETNAAVARLAERLSLWQGVQGVYTTVASIVAAVISRRL